MRGQEKEQTKTISIQEKVCKWPLALKCLLLCLNIYFMCVYNPPINLGIKLDIFTSLFLSLRLCYYVIMYVLFKCRIKLIKKMP